MIIVGRLANEVGMAIAGDGEAGADTKRMPISMLPRISSSAAVKKPNVTRFRIVVAFVSLETAFSRSHKASPLGEGGLRSDGVAWRGLFLVYDER